MGGAAEGENQKGCVTENVFGEKQNTQQPECLKAQLTVMKQ